MGAGYDFEALTRCPTFRYLVICQSCEKGLSIRRPVVPGNNLFFNPTKNSLLLNKYTYLNIFLTFFFTMKISIFASVLCASVAMASGVDFWGVMSWTDNSDCSGESAQVGDEVEYGCHNIGHLSKSVKSEAVGDWTITYFRRRDCLGKSIVTSPKNRYGKCQSSDEHDVDGWRSYTVS